MNLAAKATTHPNVLYNKKGAIAHVTINRPEVMNSLNQATFAELRLAYEHARDDAAVAGVIMTGAGDRAFIAGADINELAGLSAIEAKDVSHNGHYVFDLIENLGKPVIAGERLCSGRRMRSCHGMYHQIGDGKRQIRPTRGQIGTHSRLRRNAAPSSFGRQGYCPPAHPERRHDRCSRRVSNWIGQRDRSARRSNRPSGSYPAADQFQCTACRQACDRGGQPRIGDKLSGRSGHRKWNVCDMCFN